MEGNLRGARDLVAPLTAANLKRATSLNLSQHTGRARLVSNVYNDESADHRPMRILHAQASSPTMGRNYISHARVSSENEIPERPHTALERSNSFSRSPRGRIPVKISDPSLNQSLRNSRSYDSLGANTCLLYTSPSPRD